MPVLTETVTLDRPTPPVAALAPARPRLSARRLWRGDEDDPLWARPALLTLLLGSAVLYLANLTASGWANTYYAAAAQAGSRSWTAWFFGGLDAGGAITVDKPPAAMWVMGLSMRVFGVNSAALLVPEALMGVATTAVVYATVRRLTSSPGAGLLAAAASALTPAAVLVFRFDNPDALLVLLLATAGYAMVRALQDGRTRWLILAGTAVGFGFLTKMGEALLVLPAFVLVYLVAGPHRWPRRVRQLLAAAAAVVASAGWYVALVQLWPASSRPYVAGSTNDSLWSLALGYNGLGRLLGNTAVAGAIGGGGTGQFSGAPGVTRLFSGEMAVEASWLLPSALAALLGGLWLTRHRPRTDLVRAGLALWGGWLVVAGTVFSAMQGTIHPYYTAILAPAIGGLLATTAVECWRRRGERAPRVVLVAVVVAAAAWSAVLLRRASWGTGYAVAGLVLAALVSVAMLAWTRLPGRTGGRQARALAAGVTIAAVLAGGAGTVAWAIGSASSPQTGTSPTSGPAAAVSQNSFGGGGTRGGQTGGGNGTAAADGQPAAGQGTGGGTRGGGGDSGAPSSAVVRLLQDAASYRWSAATTSAMSSAPLQLASGTSVLAVGGFSGSDAKPTLAQFQAWVASGQVKYYVASGGAGGGAGGGRGGTTGSAGSIATWVAQSFTATTIDGVTVYDLQPNG